MAFGFLIFVYTFSTLPDHQQSLIKNCNESEKQFFMMGQFNYYSTSNNISTTIALNSLLKCNYL